MDAFYASIEQRDNPTLRGKPVAVGYGEKRGVVAAASYEARRYGVRSAMASVTALRKCPHIIFVMPRFEVYKSVSNTIMEIFHDYTDEVEPLSLDEAFLDVTENKKGIRSASIIAKEIKQQIYEKTALRASAGVSYNKFLAKIASDYNKPDGFCVITPEKAEAFIDQLPIERFFGVGKVTAKQMQQLGIKTGTDLKKYTERELVVHFGKAGAMYYSFARGMDEREVQAHRVRKSLGAEETFLEDIFEETDLHRALQVIAEEVERRVEKKHFHAKTLTLKVKFADFSIITRSKTVSHPITSAAEMRSLSEELLQNVENIHEKKIRLLGITLKNADADKTFNSHIAIQLRLHFKE